MNVFKDVKLVNYSIYLILSVLYFADLPHTGWLFHFSHANVFHLCANMIAISAIFKAVDHRLLPLAYLVTTVMWFISADNIIGFSSIIYFMWGTRVIRDFRIIHAVGDKAMKPGMTYALGIGATFLISAIFPSITFSLHFFPFVAGVITSATIILYRSFKQDMTA